MSDDPRLIEQAFPLKQASLDSVHEKNVRHGHISTLHIWPARRPLAACRAALLAALLPDPGTPEKRRELCERIGGKVVAKGERKRMPSGETVEREREVTEGGILHWGRETENRRLLEWFRAEIRRAYGGWAPSVLDPFAGGGAIPLEAMRLGCEVTAADINPVAWFVLKCTLEYPQKLAGRTWPLPGFILANEEFMEAFSKVHPHLVGRTRQTRGWKDSFSRDLFHRDLPEPLRAPQANLAWQVRAWGRWVLDRARRELAGYYPTYAEFEPLDRGDPKPYERQPLRRVPAGGDGLPDIQSLNGAFSREYLADRRNPRWVAKPTVACLWARTVRCKKCRAAVPLLKTRWLCRKDNKRILLKVEPNAERTGVTFGVESNVPVSGGNNARRREHDRRLGAGTMSRSGATCPCCGTIMTMEDIRLEGRAGRLGNLPTAVVVEGQAGKEYRLPTEEEMEAAEAARRVLPEVFARLPLGMPEEPLPSKEALGFRVPLYGFGRWSELFSPRQLLALGTLAAAVREAWRETAGCGDALLREAVTAYLAILVDKLADYGSMLCTWHNSRELIGHTFARFALPITWDWAELCPVNRVGGGLEAQLDWVARCIEHALGAGGAAEAVAVRRRSAVQPQEAPADLVVTDPPYYDAIPYSDLMDFFYIWLRRMLSDLTPQWREAFRDPLAPKWDAAGNDGELIDDASRHGDDRSKSRAAYEQGMERAFRSCQAALRPEGRLVVVFAHKRPEAWGALASAIIRAGFTVEGSWPIQTEMGTRMRAAASAALASSIWLVCRKRPETAKPGWDTRVLEEMRRNIHRKLHEFWDAGLRGPDFVWAATGPALEAYSRHPVVRKANQPGPLTVEEFLGHVRRMVVDFVVGRVLAGDREEGEEPAAADRLDEPTAYYLLHRHDFGLEEAPAGACILYALSCGLSDRELAATWNLIGFTQGRAAEAADEEETAADGETATEAEEETGSRVRLKSWTQRGSRSLGFEAPGGRPVPLIDRVHCLMHLWKAGEISRIEEYLDGNGLRRQELFRRLLQSLIELSPAGSEERSLLECLSSHLRARGPVRDEREGMELFHQGSTS